MAEGKGQENRALSDTQASPNIVQNVIDRLRGEQWWVDPSKYTGGLVYYYWDGQQGWHFDEDGKSKGDASWDPSTLPNMYVRCVRPTIIITREQTE